jgi:CheY-like chemotaxis protein
VVSNVIAELRPKAAEKGQTLSVLAEPPLPYVRADPDRLAQILTNLVDNAIKYTPSGGHVTIDAEEAGGFLHLCIKDNGIGVSREDQKKLFSRFFRAESALLSGTGGAGLGLYITRSLVELHGGEIWVDSGLGEGSTFSFSLPVATREEKTTANHEFKTISYRSQDKHVLVIEDESDVANRVAHYLRGLGGYRVHVSRYGRSALKYLESNEHRVDLIALDLHLSDMDGYELLGKLKAVPATRDIPVIAIAGGSAGTQDVRQRVLEMGAAQLVDKPIEVGDLVREIQQVLPDGVEPSREEPG